MLFVCGFYSSVFLPVCANIFFLNRNAHLPPYIQFDMPDTIRLWDALFADSKRFDFLIVVCVAIITTQRDHLLKCDFATAIQLLQRPYSLGIERLLGQATQAYRESDRGGLDLPDGVERGNNSKREIAGIHAEEVEKALKKVAAASQETASRLLGKLRTWASAEKKPKSLTRMSPIRKTKKDDIMENHPAKGLGARDMAKAETLVTEKETALTSIDVRGTQSHLKPSSSHEFIEPTNLFANAEDDCDLFDSD